jgi:thioredoxin-related protein
MLAVIFLALASIRADAYELVMFGKAGCVWCARWEREVGQIYPAQEEGRIAPLQRVDIRDQGRIGLDLEEPVVYTPTFVLSENGVEIGRITGYQGEDMFWGTLGDMLRQGRPRRR